MHTLLIIAHTEGDMASLTDLLRQNRANMIVRYAADTQAAVTLAREHLTDAIIFDLASFPDSQVEHLHQLTMKLPDVPCIAIIDEDGRQADPVLRAGVSKCLARPVRPEPFSQMLNELAHSASYGHLRGIPTHSLLQMLEGEQRTCSVRVTSKGQTGTIFLLRGQVIDAWTRDRQGLTAFNTIILWEEPSSEIRYFNGRRPRTIDKPLVTLIMNGFHPKNGKGLEDNAASPAEVSSPLKHQPAIGSRLAIDIGAKIKIELDGKEPALTSTLVGMVPDELLIVTSPPPSPAASTTFNTSSRIVVKYLYMGRLCMFRTRMLSMIDSPGRLIFLDYPQAVHYQELRRAKRRSIFIPCTMHLVRGPEFYGILIDLSSAGCLCQIKTRGNTPLPPLDIESKVQLHCLMPGLKEDQELAAVVKTVRHNNDETLIGLEFFGLQAYLKEAIEHYVYATEEISV